MSIEVEPLAGDDAGYRIFVDEAPSSSVYWTLPWRDFLARAVGGTPRYLVARDGGDIVGVLPSFALDGEAGTVVNSLPWYGSHGGCLLRADDAEGRAALLDALAASLPDTLVSCTIVLTPEETPHFDAYAAALGGTAADERIGQVTRLPPGAPDASAALERIFGQKTRNLVRKARRQGFAHLVTSDEWAWDFLLATHEANMAAIGGKPKPRTHFDALRAALPASWLRLAVALDGETPVAAVLLVRYGDTVEYLTPVIEHQARPRQPLSFLVWEEMLAATADGFSRWNWGGTWHGQRSLHHFKAGFGADDLPYRYVVASPRPDAVAANARALGETFPYYYVYPFG